jgi:hypothetical protein
MLSLCRNVTGRDSEATKLFASANQAVSDAVTSIRVVQAYNLQKHVSETVCEKCKPVLTACKQETTKVRPFPASL